MIQIYNTAVALSTNFPYSSVPPSRTQPGPPRHAVLIHGVQLPVSYSTPVIFVHSVGFVIRLGYLRYHSAGFAITRLASLSLSWLRYHSVGFTITRLASLSLGWFPYHSVVFAITRLASLSLSWLPYHLVGFAIKKKYLGDTKFCNIIAFCEMNKILFVTTLFPRLDTLGNLNNSP
jgi:hypothetical protein